MGAPNGQGRARLDFVWLTSISIELQLLWAHSSKEIFVE